MTTRTRRFKRTRNARFAKVTRRRFLAASGALAAAPALSALARADAATSAKQPAPAGPAGAGPLHFIAFGDWGTGTPHQKSVAEAMARYAESRKAASPVQFAISLGDNFYEHGVSSVDDPQWQTKFEQMYDAKRLPMPFISILGNHDWLQDPAVQIGYAGAHPGTRWQMDAFWFKRTYPAGAATPLAEFFYIDTDLWNYGIDPLQDRQMEWLTNGLTNSRATWRIVVGHHPLYSNGEHAHDSDVLTLRARLSPLFKQLGVDVYLCGHDHDLQRNQLPDHPTLFLISGAAGKLRGRQYDDWKPFYASTPGFAALTITPTEFRSEFIDAGGKVIDSWKQAPVPRRPVVADVAAPAATAVLSGAGLPELSIVFTDPDKASGLSIPSAGDGVTDAVTVAGSPARRAQGSYLYVAIDEPAYRGPLNLWVTIEALKDTANLPAVQYDRAAATPDRTTRYTRAQGDWTPLENGWQRGVFALPAARLAKGQNHGAEFRLSGKAMVVRKITVAAKAP